MLRPKAVIVTTFPAIGGGSGSGFGRWRGTNARGLSYKRAVAAIVGFDKSNVRVQRNLSPSFRRDPYERIVRRVHDQRWNRDAIEHVNRRSAVVVIVDAGETAIVRRHLVIKLAQAPDAAQAADIEVSGKQPRLLQHAAAKVLCEEIGSVDVGCGDRAAEAMLRPIKTAPTTPFP